MATFLVFNDLSSTPIAHDTNGGKQYLNNLSDVLLDQRLNGRKVLVTPPNFLQLQVSAGYPIGRWLADNKDEEVRRKRLKTLFDRRIDYTECVPADRAESPDIEYKCGNEVAHGVSVAFISEGLAVSFWSSDRWNVSALDLEKAWLSNSGVETTVFAVPHACRAAHLEAHSKWLSERQQESPSSGIGLWDAREMLFPNLDFCESAGAQIRSLLGGELRFKAVLRGLRDLQNYCDTWETPNFDIHQLVNASGESASTLQMFAAERTFKCPDGEYRLFEWHLKRGDNTRIHFLDQPNSKRIVVGYVGSHLRISSQ